MSSLVIFESGEFGGIDCGSLAGYCEFDFQEGLDDGDYLLHLEIEIDDIGTIRLQHFFKGEQKTITSGGGFRGGGAKGLSLNYFEIFFLPEGPQNSSKGALGACIY